MSKTVFGVFSSTVDKQPDAIALKTKRDGQWQGVTWQQYRDNARGAARGMMALGLQAGDGVGILAGNSEEWLFGYMGGVAAGGVPAGLYTTSSADQVHYVLEHSDSVIAQVDTEEQLAKVLAVRDRLPKLKAIVTTHCESSEEGVYSWAQLLEKGQGVDDAELQARIDAQGSEDIATLIYTSGTTGNPKGVMMSHRNLTWVGEAAAANFDMGQGDCLISYLPLCHIAEQNLSIHCAIAMGTTIWFAESIDKLGDNLKDVRPHVFLAVPRVWEKIQAKIEAGMSEATGLKAKLLNWAGGVGRRYSANLEAGKGKPALYGVADKLVFSKAQAALGLDRCYYACTGAAPISQGTLDFFAGLGIIIHELYGQSETTGAGTMMQPGKIRRGTIGQGYPGTEVRIAEDGEIMLRGDYVSPGYHKNPEATADTFTQDGWVHTGDVGEIDADGFVKITDRKKELIITAGGENISPTALEAELMSIPGVSQVAAIGDKRKFVTALFTLDPETFPAAKKASGTSATTPREAANDETFKQWFEAQVAEVNKRFARVQTIKKFTILPEDFSVDGGELTPTMKKKRRVIHDKYESQIEDMYAGT